MRFGRATSKGPMVVLLYCGVAILMWLHKMTQNVRYKKNAVDSDAARFLATAWLLMEY